MIDVFVLEQTHPLKDSASAAIDACLSGEERAWKIALRRQWRAALRHLLGRALNCQPHQVVIQYNRHGKPELADHAVHFSVSHSGRFALIGLSSEGEIGVDVEEIRTLYAEETLMSRVLSRDEYAHVQALSAEERTGRFLQLWARKESVLKALGTGVNRELSSVEVLSDQALGCEITDLMVASDYRAALASVTPLASGQVRIFRHADAFDESGVYQG